MNRTIFKISASFSVAFPKFDHQPAKYNGIPFEKVKADRNAFVPPFTPYLYKEPLLMTEGKAQYLFDYKGTRYQDWISGISTVSVGHSHPVLVNAITDQYEKLGHVSQAMLSDVQSQYAKMLCERLGPGFDAVYLCNSGG